MKRVPDLILRRMGYKADSQGIIDRYIHIDGSWEEHLERARQFLLKTINGKGVNNLAVYGSGWLLDFPLDEISAMTGHIWLYDAIHPRQVLHRLRLYKNVTAIQTDITGGVISGAYQAAREYRKHGIQRSPEFLCDIAFSPDKQPDFTISLNILSQIGAMITDYLKRYIPYNQEELDRIIALLQQSHLKLLHPGRSCLITDMNERSYNEDNQLTEITELIKIPLPLPENSECWDWQFDPLGGYKPGSKTVSKVVAMVL